MTISSAVKGCGWHYTTVERNAQDATIMELTGDAITNPDLRSFFFQGENESDCETWTKALLSDRHQALRDVRVAYKQVCDSFPLQLSHCSRLIDEAEAETKLKEKEIYYRTTAGATAFQRYRCVFGGEWERRR
mmetsp:Transcript_44756/g.53796  ORF Transcript_44756/g.53796 Transcript_44756/m.53796 type:complete len:133 (+) Transcript_44756:822-1220(+)